MLEEQSACGPVSAAVPGENTTAEKNEPPVVGDDTVPAPRSRPLPRRGWEAGLEDRYVLGAVLGSGSVAEVRRAEDTRLCRPVAIKLFPADPDPVAQQRFTAEARVLAQLHHPGLVAIYDAGIDGARPFLVMQLIEGRSLRGRILRGPLPVAETARLGSALASAMDHMHRRGVVHRDVKPSNILIDEDGEPLLADFGIARLAGSHRITGSNQLVGTACYLAPEQLLNREVAAPIDVYALGLVLLECLTGELVYPGDNQLEAALSRLDRRPGVPAGLPGQLAALLTAMTDPEPANRPAAGACAQGLAAVAGGNPMAPPTVLLSAASPDPLAAPDLRPSADPLSSPDLLGPPADPSAAADPTLTADLTADPLATICRSAGRRTRLVFRRFKHTGRPVPAEVPPPKRNGAYLTGAGAVAAMIAGVVVVLGTHGAGAATTVPQQLAPGNPATAALDPGGAAHPATSGGDAVQPVADVPSTGTAAAPPTTTAARHSAPADRASVKAAGKKGQGHGGKGKG
jgi:eukaryotic-like serine/threonine-protein kinase